MSIHIDEDGRCSWCGWPGPDWEECDVLAWHWGASCEDVYWERWRQHLEGHVRHREPLPELDAACVLREAQAILWLAGAD